MMDEKREAFDKWLAEILEKEKLPDDPVKRCEIFARELAWGVAKEWWGLSIAFGESAIEQEKQSPSSGVQLKNLYLEKRWRIQSPRHGTMIGFDYLTNEGRGYYTLTSKAFKLLEKPSIPLRVFISYWREMSSSFALLVEARLRIVGINQIFVDKHLQGGDEWESVITQYASQCNVLICLIGKGTLARKWVETEIQLAHDAGARIIPILHPFSEKELEKDERLLKRQAIFVADESAKGYEQAVNEILNVLGYPTY